jgi:hypothetical protein
MLAIEFAVMFPASVAADKWHWSLDTPAIQALGFALSIAWVAPFNTYFAVPAAAALLLIPTFFASVWIERWVCIRQWPTADRAKIRQGVFRANLASYGILVVLGCGWTVWELLTKKPASP